MLAVDAVETSLDDGHGGVAIFEDFVEARIVGGAKVGHLDSTALKTSSDFDGELEKCRLLKEQQQGDALLRG